MTREEQRLIRELKKPLGKTCKEIGKRRGWKTIAGEQYRERDGMLYMLIVSIPPVDCGKMLKMNIRCKPPALDEVYWDVFHIAEEAEKQPFSFHVNGAFTAPSLWLPVQKLPLPGPEALESVVEAIFDRTEELVKEHTFPDIASYRARLEADSRSRSLEIILCLLCEEKYPQAMELIEKSLLEGERGGFLRENGRRSIMEDAREYCAARLEGQA
ncbi:hypothetical protein [uncultured Oscillibacter sp.]|uniref:hypothetical protein n=1 Tax=uncultured Oscillibacter sp. TaxID=876091 RepID=UPI0026298CDF|nr:hypothetical protein [uncultured Oscillibacter sp.]